MGTIGPATAKMKHLLFLMVFGFAVQNWTEAIDVGGKAASTYQNCDCQCNSDTWTDGNYIRGNCNSKDKSGALFCYVSGNALCSCRDIQVSSFLKDNNGRYKYYSYEACSTPERRNCNFNCGNLGDGDLANIYKYCPGGYRQSSNYRRCYGSSFGGSNSNYGSSNSNYRPPNNNYRPPNNNFGSSNSNFGSSNSNYGSSNSNFGSSNFGSSNSNYGSNNYKPPRGQQQTLDDILSGRRKTGSSSSSSVSSDAVSSDSSAVNF